MILGENRVMNDGPKKKKGESEKAAPGKMNDLHLDSRYNMIELYNETVITGHFISKFETFQSEPAMASIPGVAPKPRPLDPCDHGPTMNLPVVCHLSCALYIRPGHPKQDTN